jgi:UDP-N-acetylmuramyl pentapeptide phosphotransferase/UDP-N-acetylglucosamine-1-phosphate transferase
MRINRNTQIPNMIVYGILYAIVFGVSIWLLVFHNESPTNWVLYVLMAVAGLMGLAHFALHLRKKNQRSA